MPRWVVMVDVGYGLPAFGGEFRKKSVFPTVQHAHIGGGLDPMTYMSAAHPCGEGESILTRTCRVVRASRSR